jgi:dienelactone hydrolase
MQSQQLDASISCGFDLWSSALTPNPPNSAIKNVKMYPKFTSPGQPTQPCDLVASQAPCRPRVQLKDSCRRLAVLGATSADSTGALNDSATPCLLIVPDIFGLSKHAQLLADEMNRRSDRPVVLIDVFQGGALPTTAMERLLPFAMPAVPGAPPKSLLAQLASFCWGVPVVLSVLPTLLPFAWRHLFPAGKAAKLPLVESVAQALQDGCGGTRKLGLVGYCYGGDAAIHFNAHQASPFAATAVAHGHVSLPQVEALLRPALFICAENDFAFPEHRVLEAEAMVRRRADYTDSQFRFRRFAGTYHGFAIRGDERNGVIEKAKGRALDELVDFFKAALG